MKIDINATEREGGDGFMSGITKMANELNAMSMDEAGRGMIFPAMLIHSASMRSMA